MTTALELRKRGAVFVLDGSPSAASLRPHRGLRGAEITVDGRTVAIGPTDHRPCGVVTADGLLRLHPQDGRTPAGEPVAWSLRPERGSYRAAVVRAGQGDDDRIDLRLPRLGGRVVEISVSGAWADLELLVLAASFALLARRRGDRVRAAIVAGAIGHGH
ncbi:hypothetical protein ABH931_007310 [Streptacidiphilus sp. MAP12-33]|uniref:hypothetical protein n=1 Tax=Streptacidiphilus sp. MAP12-33 TaxID=3156266 RepID=UPI0035136E26